MPDTAINSSIHEVVGLFANSEIFQATIDALFAAGFELTNRLVLQENRADPGKMY